MTTYIKNLFMQYIKSPYTYIAILLPFVLLTSLGSITPIGLLLPFSISSSIVIIIMFLFAGKMQETRSTTLIKFISLTKISKPKYVMSNIIVATFFVFFSIILLIGFTYLLDTNTNFLLSDFSGFGESILFSAFDYTIVWNSIHYFKLIIALLISISLAFMLAFFIISITKTVKMVYIFSVIYLFLLLLVGGVLVPVIIFEISDTFVHYFYYFIPHFYTNQLIQDSFSLRNEFIILYWGVFIVFIQNNNSVLGKIISMGMADLSEYADSVGLTLNEVIFGANWDAIGNDAQYVIDWYATIDFANPGDISYGDDFVPGIIEHQYESVFFNYLVTGSKILPSPFEYMFKRGGELWPLYFSRMIYFISFFDWEILTPKIEIFFSYYNSSFSYWELILISTLEVLFLFGGGLYTFKWSL